MKTLRTPSLSIAAALLLAACGTQPQTEPSAVQSTPASGADSSASQGSQDGFERQAESTTSESDPVSATAVAADAFLDNLRQHCGESFAGRIVANEPPQPDDAFEGKPLVMHVRECSEDELKIPFHVGDDHSRTWVLTRTDTGLRLKHDHRHQDGSEDAVTQYGGDTASVGTATRQEFPVDQFSIDMFEAGGMDVSTTNTWAMEIEPKQRFLYELSRPGGRMFQVEFDLTQTMDTPPTPWGHPELD